MGPSAAQHVDNLEHFAPLQRPAQFNRVLLGFLRHGLA